MALSIKLKILTGRHSGREIEVRRSKFVIGRADDCDLRPASHEVSRWHCALLVEAAAVKLQDLGGSNGTFVNGERIAGERELTSGDRIKVGPLEFQAIFVTASAADKPGGPQPTVSDAPAPGSPKSAGSAASQGGENPSMAANQADDDDVMQWLTDAPGPRKPIFLEPETDASGSDTGQISLDATQPMAWPESPQTSAPLPESASRSELRNSGNPAANLPDPNAAENSRDAAAAAIDKFRHRKDKLPPKAR